LASISASGCRSGIRILPASLSWEGGRVDPVEPVTGVSLGGCLAQIDDLVLALEVAEEAEGVAEHPPRMRKPPSKVSERAVFAIRLEMLLRPTPPTALVD
jgi:hypothetical protein